MHTANRTDERAAGNRTYTIVLALRNTGNMVLNIRTLEEQKNEFKQSKLLATPIVGLIAWLIVFISGLFFLRKLPFGYCLLQQAPLFI